MPPDTNFSHRDERYESHERQNTNNIYLTRNEETKRTLAKRGPPGRAVILLLLTVVNYKNRTPLHDAASVLASILRSFV